LYIRKVLIECDPLLKDLGVDIKKDFVGDGVGAYTYEGKLWGIPTETNLVGAQVAIPIDDVEKAGIKEKMPPYNGKDFFDSFDHLYQTASALQQKDSAGKVSKWGISSKGWETMTILSVMRSLGVQWWDNGTKAFNFKSEAGVKAFQTVIEQPVKLGVESEIDQNVVAAVTSGKIQLATGNASIPGEAKKVGYNYTQVMVPPIKGAVTGADPLYVGEGGWGFVGLANAKNRDVAVEFLKYIAGVDAQKIYAGIYGGIPSARAAANDAPRWGDTKNPQ